MALKVGLGRDTPAELSFPILNAGGNSCLVDFQPVPKDMDEPDGVGAYSSYWAGPLLWFLYTYLDPFVWSAFLHAVLDFAYERLSLPRQEPEEPQPVQKVVVERIVEVPVTFKIIDPGHPCYQKRGEMLYCEDDRVWYLWIDEKPVPVTAEQTEKVPLEVLVREHDATESAMEAVGTKSEPPTGGNSAFQSAGA